MTKEMKGQLPIHMSQKLNRAQRNYTVTVLEYLAIILAGTVIEEHEFRVITDHFSLMWLMNQRDLSVRLARWTLKLQEFNFTIDHRIARDNVVADALYRRFEVDMVVSEGCNVLPLIDLGSSAFDEKQYADLKYVYLNLQFLILELLINLFISVLEFLMEVLTSQTVGGHSAKTTGLIRRYFYWSGLVVDVKNYISSCDLCKTSTSNGINGII